MVWLLRRWDLPRPAALIGATLFAFCGFNLLHFAAINSVGVACHIPWLIAAADAFLRAERPRARAGSSGRVACDGVAAPAGSAAVCVLLRSRGARLCALEGARGRPLGPCAALGFGQGGRCHARDDPARDDLGLPVGLRALRPRSRIQPLVLFAPKEPAAVVGAFHGPARPLSPGRHRRVRRLRRLCVHGRGRVGPRAMECVRPPRAAGAGVCRS